MTDLHLNLKSPAASVLISRFPSNELNKGMTARTEHLIPAADTVSDNNNEVKQRRLKSARLIGEYAKLPGVVRSPSTKTWMQI
jgi:hypothetical protein